MKFSVIIPIFNGSKDYLKNAVLSVENQASKNYKTEIIIIDDASTDGSFEYAQELAKKHKNVNVFRLKKNAGPGAARNIGINKSQGDFLFFLDSDDTFSKDAFDNVYRVANDKTDIVAFNWRYGNKTAKSLTAIPTTTHGRDDLKVLEKADNIISEYLLHRIDNSVIYSAFKKTFLSNHNFSFREGLHEDVDFTFKAVTKAANILTINKPLYIKNDRKGNIINTMTKRHIEGYFGAIYQIHKDLCDSKKMEQYKSAFVIGAIGVVATHAIKIAQIQTENAIEDKGNLLNILYTKIKKLLIDTQITNYKNYLDKTQLKTKHWKIFDFFMDIFGVNEKDKEEKTLRYLVDIKDKYWSCYDLHKSIFLAPDEIRTCCKRYFHKNEFKGDVVILSEKDGIEFNYNNIVNAKNKLFRNINNNNAPACEGCPFLKFKDWGGKPLEQEIEYLSLEYHSICNMKCTYCSETYYGGKKAIYDVEKLVSELKQNNKASDIRHVVWGGGEPTADKSFKKIINLIDEKNPPVKRRIITNAVLFKQEVLDLLNKDVAYVVTSIDAGKRDTFNKIRGIDKLDKVMKNLRLYAQDSPHNVIVKYLLLPEPDNSSDEEISAFVDLVKKYQLLDCNFQISYDFKSEFISDKMLSRISYLYCLLLDAGADFIFCDDLIWQRLGSIKGADVEEIKDALENYKLANYIADAQEYDDVIVWGTGSQSQILMKKSNFFKNTNVRFFIDPDRNLTDKSFFKKDIKLPQALKNNTTPVYIAAVQSAPLIYRQYHEAGFDKNLIIKKLVI